jgi:hypothetical protein
VGWQADAREKTRAVIHKRRMVNFMSASFSNSEFLVFFSASCQTIELQPTENPNIDSIINSACVAGNAIESQAH